MVEKELAKLRDHEVLEDRSAQRMTCEVRALADAKQVPQQARVHDVQLGALDQPLGKVLVMWAQEVDDVAGAQDRKPLLGGDMADTGVGSERRGVDELAGTSGAQTGEPV